MEMDDRRKILQKVHRVVIKIGSTILTEGESGLNSARIVELVDEVVSVLQEKKIEIAIVSSGAVAAGMGRLGLKSRPREIPVKQAAAAVGQGRLIWCYKQAFLRHRRKVAQILLTADDLKHRRRFLNARNALETLFHYQVVPIINENDTVVVEEMKFGDNDRLSALVTNLIGADLLLILSDIDGLYTGDPHLDDHAERIPLVPKVTEKTLRMAGESYHDAGSGGMRSKVKTAKTAAAFGTPTLVVNGHKRGVIKAALSGEQIGTLFLAGRDRLTSRKHWIAYTLSAKGKLTLDAGAVRALLKQGRSLLPSGITGVEGRFEVGDPVSCLDPEGLEVARGLVNYHAREIKKILGHKTREIEEILGYKYYDEVIHRNDLVVLRVPAG
ncbi:MAG: glutamate 5-kinase [Deltaproteobacteria bacterium]|nr:glutamate 5-kinase [Deltaproteobacteria bacterium]